MMTQEDVLKIFLNVGAIRTAADGSGEMELDPELVYSYPKRVAFPCFNLAVGFADQDIETVVASERGSSLAYSIARAIMRITHESSDLDVIEVCSLDLSRVNEAVMRPYISPYIHLLKGKRVLVAVGQVKTGKAVAEIVKACTSAGATVVGAGSFVDFGRVGAAEIGVPKFISLATTSAEKLKEMLSS